MRGSAEKFGSANVPDKQFAPKEEFNSFEVVTERDALQV